MAETIQAIVIKASDRKEKDKSILLFSLEKGKFWATLKGVKGANAKMKMAQNPFCFGEFVVENGKGGMIVTGFELSESFYEITSDLDKFFEATSILEIINSIEFSSNKEVAEVFVLLLKSLKTLCFSNVKNLYVLNKFLIDYFTLVGLPLFSDRCSCCGTTSFSKLYINYLVGELVCVSCKNLNSQELIPSEYLALKILSSTSFDKLKTLSLAQGSERGLLKILVKNFETRFDKRLKLMGILS
ncbi:MAG: DNA repair protein RecO [Clostridiales bacterium]|nr:DNA repair protein RecO [Clostridiales bacterium]